MKNPARGSAGYCVFSSIIMTTLVNSLSLLSLFLSLFLFSNPLSLSLSLYLSLSLSLSLSLYLSLSLSPSKAHNIRRHFHRQPCNLHAHFTIPTICFISYNISQNLSRWDALLDPVFELVWVIAFQNPLNTISTDTPDLRECLEHV